MQEFHPAEEMNGGKPGTARKWSCDSQSREEGGTGGQTGSLTPLGSLEAPEMPLIPKRLSRGTRGGHLKLSGRVKMLLLDI